MMSRNACIQLRPSEGDPMGITTIRIYAKTKHVLLISNRVPL